MNKKFFITILSILLLSTSTIAGFAAPLSSNDKQKTGLKSSSKYIFHGHAEINENLDPPEGEGYFTGETSTVKKGTKLKMTVSQVLSTGINEEGDEFFAEVTNDLEVEDGVVVPAGSIAHGVVRALEGTKRLGRDAYVTLDFDYLVTPDGREIPIEASMTTKRHAATSVAKVALENTAYTVTGGVAGGLLALKYLGLGAAVSSNGYTVAGGAGVGALVGAGYALARKGQEVLLAPGDEIKVKIKGTLDLPIISDEALKEDELQYNGLNINISNFRLEKDPFGEPNTITLSIAVCNKTKKTFSSFDMALVNDYKAVFYPSPFGNSGMWFTKIYPNSRIAGKISFSVDNPKRKHWLVFYDNRTRKPLAKVSVDNAIKKIKKNKKRRKK